MLVFILLTIVTSLNNHTFISYHPLPSTRLTSTKNWSLYISRRSSLNGYPKPRREHKRPFWYDLFDEEVEKEPLGPPCKGLALDVISGERRLRLTLKKSHKQMYATIVDDVKRHTHCYISTNFKYLAPIFGSQSTKHRMLMKDSAKSHATSAKITRNKGDTVKAAYELGKLIGRQALSKGISKVFFDRAGYRYHGRVEALAIGARKVGLDF